MMMRVTLVLAVLLFVGGGCVGEVEEYSDQETSASEVQGDIHLPSKEVAAGQKLVAYLMTLEESKRVPYLEGLIDTDDGPARRTANRGACIGTAISLAGSTAGCVISHNPYACIAAVGTAVTFVSNCVEPGRRTFPPTTWENDCIGNRWCKR